MRGLSRTSRIAGAVLAALAMLYVGLAFGERAPVESGKADATTPEGEAAVHPPPDLRAVPLKIPFQGFLRDSTGAPLDGNVTLHVALYDSPTSGTPLWGPEVHGPLPVIGGVFQINLGGAGEPLDPADFTGAFPLWLGVRVFPDAELPRTQLLAAPFAMRALEADHALTADVAVGAGVPTGTILPYAGELAPPGYLLCDGQEVSRTDYVNLFVVIGSTYGNGNGITTFNVPDLRQRFPLGLAAAGTGSTLGSAGGAIDHAHTYTQVLQHTHSISIQAYDHGTKTTTVNGLHPNHIPAGGGSWGAFGNKGERYSDGNHTHDLVIGAHSHTASSANPAGSVTTGTTSALNPPFLTVTYIIKI